MISSTRSRWCTTSPRTSRCEPPGPDVEGMGGAVEVPGGASARELSRRSRQPLERVNHVYASSTISRKTPTPGVPPVEQVNLHARDIRDLNERILKAEGWETIPTILKIGATALIEKLSNLVNISVGRNDRDETIVYVGGENLVQGEVSGRSRR